MLVVGFPAGSFQTNCYIIAPAARSEAVVIDPGEDALAGVDERCAEYHLKPVAIVLTHGHLDHIWSVAPLAGARGIPAYLHPADRHLLTDPAAGFGPELAAMVGGLRLGEPDDVRVLEDGMTLDLAGVPLLVDHTPGHTPGHVTFRGDAMVFSGDLVFAGSVGRTDLPGGSTARLLQSIAERFLVLPDDTRVLPGHGPETTVGRERSRNPFLAGLTPGEGGRAVPAGGPRA